MSEQEFDWIVAKLPRKDKDGNDTTNDKLGVGGKHREDGTFSSMPYDIEICDDGNPVEKADDLKSRLDELETNDAYHEADERTTLDAVADLAESVADLSDNIVSIVEFGFAFKEWWNDRKKKRSDSTNEDAVEESSDENFETLDEDFDIITSECDILENNNSTERKVELSIDEARLIFIDMLVNYMKFKKDYNMLASANIKGISIEIRSFDDVVSFFDRCIEIYPQLMDTSTSSIVNSILETNLVDDEIIQAKKALNILDI